MTPKQKKVLDFIMHYSEREGYQPSQQEIASGCGFDSLGTVQHYLRVLERDGHRVGRLHLERGACPRCGQALAGIFQGACAAAGSPDAH